MCNYDKSVVMETILKEILADSLFQEGVAWKKRNFNKNDFIIKQGEKGNLLFYVEEGVLRVTGDIELDENKHIQAGICDLKKGDVFGEIALNESFVRTASVQAITGGCVLEIDGEKLRQYLDSNPEAGYKFFKRLFEILVIRLHQANNRVNELFAWGLKVHDIDKYL